MWETVSTLVLLALVAQPLLHQIQGRWHSVRASRRVAALNRGEPIHIRCAARFRNAGGGRRRARLAVKPEGVFVSTADGTVSKLQLGTPDTRVTVVAELSMMVCNVAGRELEVLLTAGDDRLLIAVAARLPNCGYEHPATSKSHHL
ncbi:hypothetical protein ACIOMM_19025 [Streptomyces sp. NPDC087908]|uniref:hypothetical protein n=1 Tax=Streptomyces sp. NPDC087908 TaxID=3365820 RepID=UPI00381784BE